MADFNILDFGAVADGRAVNTEAIQNAIDACKAGDTVVVPKGHFRSGALFLKSHMTFRLDEGAVLRGSDNPADYPLMTYRYEGVERLCYASLLNTEGAPHEDISIVGKGTIHANGKVLYAAELKEKAGLRGCAVCIRNTDGLVIQDVTIREAPFWCLHPIYCKNVLIEGVSIYTKYDEDGNLLEIINGDGIDIDSCEHVRIANCLLESEDDCIAIKSGANVAGRRVGLPSSDIVIENCKFQSGFGVAMGSEMSGGIRDVYVRNCDFHDVFSIATLKAIRGRGASVRNIHYENCMMVNRDSNVKPCRWFRGALYLDAFYSYETFDPEAAEPIDDSTPIIEDIYFENISIDTIEGHAVYLCGLPERHFQRIHLKNVKAHGPYGLYVKNIDGLEMEDAEIVGDIS